MPLSSTSEPILNTTGSSSEFDRSRRDARYPLDGGHSWGKSVNASSMKCPEGSGSGARLPSWRWLPLAMFDSKFLIHAIRMMLIVVTTLHTAEAQSSIFFQTADSAECPTAKVRIRAFDANGFSLTGLTRDRFTLREEVGVPPVITHAPIRTIQGENNTCSARRHLWSR